MRIVYYPTGKEPIIAKLKCLTFPDYDGRSYELHVSTNQILVASFWRDGTRTEYCFVDMDTWEKREIGDTPKTEQRTTLPPRVVCVERRWIRGRDHGLRFHVRPEDAKPLKPKRIRGLTPDEIIVLRYTALYKASYSGIVRYRFHRANLETQITRERWEKARAHLIKRGLLMKSGALMPAGRNALIRED